MANPDRLRIVWLCQHFPKRSGGAEVFAERMVSHWHREGHAVEILSATPPSHVEPIPSPSHDFPVTNLTVSPIRFLGTAQLIRRVSHWLNQNAKRFDVVVASMLKHMAYAAMGRRALPVVLRAEGAGWTGDIGWQWSTLGGGWVGRRCRRADAIIAASPVIEGELRSAGYPNTRLRMIPNGVPIPVEPWSREATHAWRKKLDLPDRPTVTFVGRVTVEKGIDRFRQLGMALRHPQDPWNFLVVGEGPGLNTFVHNELTAGIRFTGYVPDVIPYLRASDLFVLPSDYEGLSLSLLEALALGIPSVASLIPGNFGIAPPVVLPLVPLMLVEVWMKTIETMMTDERFHSPEAIAARRRVIEDRFSFTSSADAHLELLRTVIERRKPRVH